MTHTSTEQPSAAPVLRAMAENYQSGHSWDVQDAKTCQHAASEIERLHARVQELGAQIAKDDRTLRSSVPDEFKGATSPVGAVQGYIAQLEASQARVLLSAEQAFQIFDQWMDGPGEHVELVRAIEAAHGITQEKQG